MQDVSLSTCGRSGPICPLVRLPTTAETVSSARHGGYKEEQIRFRLIKPRTYADGPTFLIGQNPLRTAITGGKIPTAAMPSTHRRTAPNAFIARPARLGGTSDLRRDEGLFVPSPRNRRGIA